MTNWRDKGRAIREAAEAERGEWSPKEGTVPLRMYNYWTQHSKDVPVQENFCHYWRVVVLWAPLWWVGMRLGSAGAAIIVVALWFGIAALMAVDGEWLAAGLFVVMPPAFFGLLHGASKVPQKVWRYVLDAVFGVGLAALVILTFRGGIIFEVVATLIGLTVLVAFLLLLGEYIAGKRRLAAEERAAAWDKLSLEQQIEALGKRAEKKPPGAVAQFFRGIGDLLVFAWQVVVSQKNKNFCPLVDIPKEETRADG